MASNTNSRKRGSDQSEKLPDPKKLRRSMADRPSRLHKMITVIVGLDEESFIVDKGTLLTSSEFFKKTLGTSLKINYPEEVELPGAEPRAFEIYLGWLATGYLYIMEEGDVACPAVRDELGEIDDEECLKWNECYTLGHLVQDCDFQDACIDSIQEKMVSEEIFMLSLAETVYGIDDRLSVHRQFVVGIAAHLWSASSFDDLTKDSHPLEFMVDFIKYVGPKMKHNAVEEKEFEEFFKDIGCKYHAHVALNKPCYKKTNPAYK